MIHKLNKNQNNTIIPKWKWVVINKQFHQNSMHFIEPNGKYFRNSPIDIYFYFIVWTFSVYLVFVYWPIKRSCWQLMWCFFPQPFSLEMFQKTLRTRNANRNLFFFLPYAIQNEMNEIPYGVVIDVISSEISLFHSGDT